MTGKAKRAQYTLEFKLEAVRLVKAGQSMAAVAATLGVVEQTLYNWVKADREGRLAGAGTKPVSPEQMELARLRAEVARLKMERDIFKKSRRSVLREGVDVKCAFIDRTRHHWPVSVLCEALEVSPSGYHQRQQRSAEDKPHRGCMSNDALLAHIKVIHAQLKGEYGWPRMWKELLARGQAAGSQADGAAWHSCTAQAQVHRDDELESQPAGCTESTGARLHGVGPEPGLDERYYLSGDSRRLGVPRGHHRPVQPAGGGLVDAAAHESGTGHRRATHGVAPASPRGWCNRA